MKKFFLTTLIITSLVTSGCSFFQDDNNNLELVNQPEITINAPDIDNNEAVFSIDSGIRVNAECHNIPVFAFQIHYGENFEQQRGQGGDVLGDSCGFGYPYFEEFGDKVKIVMIGYENTQDWSNDKNRIYETTFWGVFDP